MQLELKVICSACGTDLKAESDKYTIKVGVCTYCLASRLQSLIYDVAGRFEDAPKES